jgi:monolysocardiolipin acyltransferase
MPEGRSKPWKFFPRPGQHVSITFGQPIPEARLREALDSPPPSDSVAEADMKKPDVNLGPDLYREAYRPMPWLAPNSLGVSSALATGKNKNGDGEELARHTRTIRAALTAIVREEVQKVGYGVAGLMLGKGVKSR